jgi:hypothetical protein
LFRAPGLVFGCTESVGSRFHILHFRTSFRRYRGRGVPLSCFARPDWFSAVPRAWGPVFMFCAPGLIFGGAECVASLFLVLISKTHFRRYGGCRVPFSCCALPDSFSAVPRVSGPVFIFCTPGRVFDGTEGLGSRFHVSRARTRFRRYRGYRDPFSYFALPYSFSAVPRPSGAVIMFCAPGLVFGGTEGVGYRFQVLRSRTRFRRCQVHRVPFTCFALPGTFSTVWRASSPDFMFYAPSYVFSGTEGVGSRFHVLRARNLFRRF